MLKYYVDKYRLKPQNFRNAFIANDCSISFPLFNGLKEVEQDYVIETIKKLYKNG